MEKMKIVEVIEAFEMVRPGEVLVSVIEEGELVEGRVAEVALRLDKGIERDLEAEAEEAEAKTAAQTKSGDDTSDQGSLLDGQPNGAANIPDAKTGLKGEVKSEDGSAK